MTERATTLLAMLTFLLIGTACSSKDAGTKDKPGDQQAMSGAMEDASKSAPEKSEKTPEGAAALAETLSFSPAQVEHGKVQWAPVTLSSVARVATVPAELTVNEDRTARLGAPGRGRILSVRVQPGDHVLRGQALLVMQSSEAGMAQSDVAKATAEVTSRRAQAQYAASARARAERLLAIKAIPRQDVERAVADDEQARAALSQAEAESRRARSTSEQLGSNTSTSSGEIVLRSPLGGVVLERTAQPGAVVEAGATLIVVTEPSSLWLQVRAPEAFSGMFRRGAPLAFTVPAYPTETFTARTDAVAPGLDAMTRTLAVRGVVANSGGRLKSSMLASVRVEGGDRLQAVLLPDDAVQMLDGKPVVFIARAGGTSVRFERRTVELGARSGGRVAVTRGLAAGEVVVTSGAFAVKAQFQKGSMPAMEM